MLLDCYLKKRRSANSASNMTVIWTLLAVRFITLTSSRPSLLKPNLISEESSRSQITGTIGHAKRLSGLDKEYDSRLNHQLMRHPSHDDVTTTLRADKEETSYYWDRKKIRYVPGPSRYFDPKGRNLDELRLGDLAEALNIELPILRKSLRSNMDELNDIYGSKGTESAYKILSKLLGSVQEFIDHFPIGEKMEEWRKKTPERLGDTEQAWKNLLTQWQIQFKELGDLVLRHILRSETIKNSAGDPYRLYLYTPEKQRLEGILWNEAFGILNLSSKYKFVKESSIKEWLNGRAPLEAFTEHLKNTLSPVTALELDFQESISKSKSSENIGSLLNLLNEDSWRIIEFQRLITRSKKVKLMKYYHDIEEDDVVMALASDFLSSGDGNYVHKMVSFEQQLKQGKFVKTLIEYFEEDFLNQVHEYAGDNFRYDLLYAMSNFIMKYYPDVFKSFVKENPYPKYLSAKFEALENSISCLKSAKELNFFSSSGLWTTDLDARDEMNLIKLEEAESRRHIPSAEDLDFVEDFGLFYKNDGEMWLGKIKEDSIKRNEAPAVILQNVKDACEGIEIHQKFGTNFFLKYETEISSKAGKTTQEEKRISSVFLKDLNSWMLHMEHLKGKYNEAENKLFTNLVKIDKNLNMDKMKENIEAELNDKEIYLFHLPEIQQNIQEARKSENIISMRTNALKREILLSMNSLNSKKTSWFFWK